MRQRAAAARLPAAERPKRQAAAIYLRRPSEADITSLLSRDDSPFSYSEVGASANELTESPDPRYNLDHYRFCIGSGRRVFERAREALLAWRHFEIPWLELYGARSHAHSGQVVATLASVAGFWFLNPCRVVYVDDQHSSRAGFAYGTLTGHVEQGEERFSVVHSPSTDEVFYEVTAFSRPSALVIRLAFPLARRVQRRFVGASAKALESAAA